MMFFRLAAACLITFTLSTSAGAGVRPADFDAGRNRLIAYMLSHQLTAQHFAHKSLDDVAPAAYDLYLRQIDPRKRFLLQEDVKKLDVFAQRIDDELRRGLVVLPDKGSAIFDRRLDQVRKMTEKILADGFDVDREDTLELDPKKSSYAANLSELRDRWRRILKLQTLETYVTLTEERENKDTGPRANDTVPPDAENGEQGGEKDTVATETPTDPIPDLWQEALAKVKKRHSRYLDRLQQQTRQDHYNQFFDAVSRAFDPHTSYMPPTSKEDFDIHMRGTLEGIGALLREEDGMIKVVRIIPGSAAERQGQLQAEDTILSVAEKGKEPVDITDMRIRKAVSYIRGPKGTDVVLTIVRADGTKKVISITRDVVQIEETYVKSEIIKDTFGNKIGYIKIPSFYRDFAASGPRNKVRNCTDDFRAELWKIHKKKARGLILDLRDNGGGSLSDAVAISGMFLPGGPVVQVKNSLGDMKILADTDKKVLFKGPVIVLVNKFSASASEILAAALQDYDRALIIGGDHTHGKGTVQTIVDLNRNLPLLHRKKYEDLGALKITIQKFYRINGESTQYKGIEPDVVVPTLLDYLKTGEKHLDYSLPWDKVEPVEYRMWPDSPLKAETARRLSRQWIASTPEFKEIQEKTAIARERAEQTRVPVSLKEVRRERRELATLSENGSGESPHLGNPPAADKTNSREDKKPLLEQLKEDPTVQLAVFLMDELTLQR